jgi:DNA-binding transcriptional ArsR family regulator
MDSLVTAAARALKAGDPLGALKRIALRDDAPALALRGIAMAQLGEFAKANVLLRRAARSFGPRERVERARCVTAQAEVALASRDLRWPTHALDEARRTFGALGDHDNRLHAALLQIRRLLLLGRVTEAGAALDNLDLRAAPAMLTARGELVAFEIALRRGHTAPARAALARARAAADRSSIDPLCAEVDRAERTLALPAARLIAGGEERPLVLAEVETVLASQHLIVDACRRAARSGRREVRLARRPVLFALLRALAEAWPGEATREILCERAFRARRMNETHRARLRVELGRLRAALRPLARIEATRRGFALTPIDGRAIVVLAPPIDGPAGSILALLEGGESWSTSALAHALGAGQRTVQRVLRELEEAAAVRAVGRGRSRRWLAPALGGFATNLLLPGALPV